MTPAPAEAPTTLFRSSWSVYEILIEQNCMSHREIHERVRSVLGARATHGPYVMLDLGCGSALPLAPILQACPPARYEGVDLSRVALDEARERLCDLPSVKLHEQDMLACAASLPRGGFDVVYSSFAMHHLSAEGKERMLGDVASLLAPGGEFLLVDVFRDEGQDRAAYVDRYVRTMRQTWTGLEPAEVDEIARHIENFDCPETESGLAAMAAEAGLGRINWLDRFGPHRVVSLQP